jgi:hypothetical protein
MNLRTIHVDRYITPLREGGSLPAIIEADDEGLYVLKFRGAGQGKKVLIAELIAGEIARTAGLAIPELVFAHLDADLARTEPDREVQSLIRASGGLNIAMDYLPGSVTFDPVAHSVDSALAAKIVWLDAFITNVDRTVRNSNMLMWHKKLWLIDHGASLFFHYDWRGASKKATQPFALIKDHVFLKFAKGLPQADTEMKAKITEAELARIIGMIPDDWLDEEPTFAGRDEHRNSYLNFLKERLNSSQNFVQEAIRASSANV